MPRRTTRADAERRRLEHRAERIERVIGALRERAAHRQAKLGHTPAPLDDAIAGFGRELHALRRARRHLG